MEKEFVIQDGVLIQYNGGSYGEKYAKRRQINESKHY